MKINIKLTKYRMMKLKKNLKKIQSKKNLKDRIKKKKLFGIVIKLDPMSQP